MSGALDKVSDIGNTLLHNVGLGALADDNPAKREADKAGRKAKMKARRDLKVLPDKDALRTSQRKAAARRRARGSGRSSTVLSSPDSGLGG